MHGIRRSAVREPCASRAASGVGGNASAGGGVRVVGEGMEG